MCLSQHICLGATNEYIMLDLTKIEINKRCYLDNVRDMRGQARIREREGGGADISTFLHLLRFKMDNFKSNGCCGERTLSYPTFFSEVD